MVGCLGVLQPSRDHEGVANMLNEDGGAESQKELMFTVTRAIKLMAPETVLPLELACVLFFPFGHTACGILVPQPGIEPEPSAVKALSPHHWTARELPKWPCF